jgi:hypothetical protein
MHDGRDVTLPDGVAEIVAALPDATPLAISPR